uniref:Uncharacterized protein n=1 Tax=Arundo donax TaxID=35708 RepID=A0A0A9EBM9_ARUDO
MSHYSLSSVLRLTKKRSLDFSLYQCAHHEKESRSCKGTSIRNLISCRWVVM